MDSRIARPGKQKVFAKITVKALVEDGESWTIEGIATTPTTDRMGDSVNPMGVTFKTPLPLLLYHDSTLPVGQVTYAKATKAGISFKASLPKVKEAGVVQDRVNEAFHSIKYKLIAACSIGFTPDYDAMKRTDTGWDFEKSEWLELSLIPIPAQPEAVITGLKSFDQALRAASGTAQSGHRPGASGELVRRSAGLPSNRSPKGNPMKTLQQLREERSQKVDRLNELKSLWETENRDGTDEEDTEADTLSTEVKALDKDIRKAQIDEFNISKAVEVDGRSSQGGSASRAGKSSQIIVRSTDPEDKFQGQSFTRMAIAKAIARLEGVSPSQVAQARWGKTNPMLVQVVRANEIGGGDSISAAWGNQLVQANTLYSGDFITFLYAQTVFDKLPLREVPANVMIKGQDGAASANWVGHGKAIPVSKPTFTDVILGPLKVAALSVVTNELLRDSTPSAEVLVRDSLAMASAEKIDATFLSAAAASANVSPAGILHGIAATGSTGEDSTALRQDILSLYTPFIAANNASDLAYVTTPAVAKAIGLIISSLGVPLYPSLGANGGTLLGDPVYTGNNVPARALILLKPSDIYEIGDLGITVSVSQEATIEQSSAPIGDTVAPTAMTQYYTNMFQSESTAFKVVRPINFALRRASAVAWIQDAAYGSATT